MNAKIDVAFDVGHSSIGWAVLNSGEQESNINLLGCGAVIFRADDCLASSRRTYRRQRRHIRSTRQRIARMKSLLKHLGVLTEAELNKPGCAWPWLLAARVLRGGKPLTWPELWDVLRWYAHNRGYDGNRRWSAADTEAQKEDSEKEANARACMGQFGTNTMAETFCAISGLDPLGTKKSTNLPGDKRPKGRNAAFPREIVENEVRKILKAHTGKLKGADANLEEVLFSNWRAILCHDLKLPKRYEGGLLFGQLVPRFDNRIISICPISGQKVPSRNCPEFLNFRWVMQLANIKLAKFKDRDLRPLTSDERKTLDKQIRERGYLTPTELKKAVRELTACERDNLDTMFIHPDAKEALLLNPVQKLISSDEFQPFWKLLPERLQKRLRGQWKRWKSLSLAQICSQLESLGGDVAAFDTELQRQLDVQNAKAKKKDKQITREQLLAKHFPSQSVRLDGRAAFARHLLKQTYEEVLAGKHPKEEGGCLFISEETRQKQLNREIANQTNNHLVRHRLLILERLLIDIVKEYADGKKERVAKVTIEVNRDLREMSGKTAKEKAQDLGLRIANHHAVAEKLEKAFAEEDRGKSIPITAGLIRKARIAEDLGWICPYTGVDYEPKNLVTRYVDKDHIVPRSLRPSDGLDSLVVTFSEINRWKGNRTAWQFVSDEQGKTVPNLPNLSIVSLSRYKQFVESLETYKGHDDDKRRKKKRKELMLLPKYEEKEFTPRDLTQTSQLVRLGAQILRKNLPHLTISDITSLPGSVTGAVRKSWKLLGCLATANPQVLDETGEVKSKTDIRDITHLHHALDACVLGLASHFIPNNGRIWELIIKRNLNDLEKQQLMALNLFDFNAENRFAMRDLDEKLKEQIRQRLAEKRIVQHVPARMDGLRVEQNTWRVVTTKDGEVILKQRIRQPDGTRPEKVTEEKSSKLLGLNPLKGSGKLAANKGALVIPDNFGVALDPQPVVIPFHKVWTRLQDLKNTNGGKIPRVLRNGQLIQVPEGKFKGVWRIFSAKNNTSGMAVDMGQPDIVRLKNKTEGHKINVLLASLLKNKMTIARTPLTGTVAS
jgi:CRISPR/Cas system Type II protein with McrA/HNH and RuvC-like nuclease domain